MTNLLRYEPNQEMQGVFPPMRRFWDLAAAPSPVLRLADDLTQWPAWSASFNRLMGDNLRVDMVETDDEVVVTAAVPGIDPDQIVIEEQDGWLSIRSQQAQENDRTHMGWHLRERTYSAWRRTLRLPAGVSAENATAELKNGVLTVRLPKQEGHRPLHKRIKVNLPKFKLPRLGKRGPKVEVISGKRS